MKKARYISFLLALMLTVFSLASCRTVSFGRDFYETYGPVSLKPPTLAEPTDSVFEESGGDTVESETASDTRNDTGRETGDETLSPGNTVEDYAHYLEAKYGFSVVYPIIEAGVEIAKDYTTNYTPTESELREFFGVLDEYFSIYPENLFEVLPKAYNGKIHLAVCGDIRGIGGNTVAKVAGLTYNIEYDIYLALDIQNIKTIESTISHELMHVIERAMKFGNPDAELFADWQSLNPNDFEYSNSYASTGGDTQLVYDPEKKNFEKAYFAETYSMTNDKEDRATLFELMIKPNEGFEKCRNLLKKAEKTEEEIKKYYPELYLGEKPVWQTYKGK